MDDLGKGVKKASLVLRHCRPFHDVTMDCERLLPGSVLFC